MADEDITGRDIRTIWRTVVIAATVVAICISGVVTAAIWATKMDARVEAVEKWQSSKDREAARELWRRDREHPSTKEK